MGDEEARSLRNFFVTGLYENVINEAESSSDPASRVYYFRALLETDPEQVFKEINDSAPTALQAIKLLGTFRRAESEQRELVHETLNEWLSDSIVCNDPTLRLIASYIYFEEENYKEALKLVANAGENLEQLAMQVMIYMKISRMDLAAKAVKNMSDIDDDDALSQLCTSWLYITQGGEKLQEASFLLQELIDKFGKSEAMLISLGVCHMHMNNFTEANTYLKQARALTVQDKKVTSPDTMINFISCLLHAKGNPAILAKIQSELEEKNQSSTWVQQQQNLSQQFDQHAATYAL